MDDNLILMISGLVYTIFMQDNLPQVKLFICSKFQ